MRRGIAGVVSGLIAWFLVATVVNLLLRVSWPGYAEAEKSFAFTLAMMMARLALGALASLCGGFAAAWISKANGIAVVLVGLLLIALFVPVHYRLWDMFPLWYHVIFLASLLPLTWLGAKLTTVLPRPASTSPPRPE